MDTDCSPDTPGQHTQHPPDATVHPAPPQRSSPIPTPQEHTPSATPSTPRPPEPSSHNPPRQAPSRQYTGGGSIIPAQHLTPPHLPDFPTNCHYEFPTTSRPHPGATTPLHVSAAPQHHSIFRPPWKILAVISEGATFPPIPASHQGRRRRGSGRGLNSPAPSPDGVVAALPGDPVRL